MAGFNVLMYHEIINKEDFDYEKYRGIKIKQDYNDILPPVLFCYLENFEIQMKYLFDQGYVTLTLKDVIDYYYNKKALPEKSILITFDDMYKSVLVFAYPILKQYGFRCVGFVVRDWLFDESKEYSVTESVCLSIDELGQMTDVFEYANHTQSLHTRNSGIGALETIDKALFLDDLMCCEQFVTTQSVFAYPFGIYSDSNVVWLKEAEFLLAFTSEEGLNTKDTNPYKLHRNGVLLNYDIEKFKTII